jgi:hypothetical protein
MWAVMEDLCLRYENIAMAGPHYDEFVVARLRHQPFTLNTRIYSCNLIRNDVPFRWRCRYNEDTVLSLDMLKGGWCTVLFNTYTIDKEETQKLPGGCTAEFYLAEGSKQPGKKYSDTGTTMKSVALVNAHPDVSKVAHRWQRVHHIVDYSSFKNRKLIRKKDVAIPAGPNEYGLVLAQVKPPSTRPWKRPMKKAPVESKAEKVKDSNTLEKK